MNGSIGWDYVIFSGGFWCQKDKKKNQFFESSIDLSQKEVDFF